MSTYSEACAGRCKWCKEGNWRIDHESYGARHILTRGDSWDESEHVSCVGPTPEQFMEEQAAQIKSLAGNLNAALDLERIRYEECAYLTKKTGEQAKRIQELYEAVSVLGTKALQETARAGAPQPGVFLDKWNTHADDMNTLIEQLQMDIADRKQFQRAWESIEKLHADEGWLK